MTEELKHTEEQKTNSPTEKRAENTNKPLSRIGKGPSGSLGIEKHMPDRGQSPQAGHPSCGQGSEEAGTTHWPI